jgi:hypothetical protein
MEKNVETVRNLYLTFRLMEVTAEPLEIANLELGHEHIYKFYMKRVFTL